MEEIVEEPSRGRPVGAADVEKAAARIYANTSGRDWVVDIKLDLGAKYWVPNAVSDDGTRLLYVFLQEELPRYVRERLNLATKRGIRPTLALELPSLFKPDIVEFLVSIDADVIVLDDYVASRQLDPKSVLVALADVEVPVSPDLRRSVAKTVWSRIGDGTSQEKGRRLEELLAFTFGQVQDLKVVERNYRRDRPRPSN